MKINKLLKNLLLFFVLLTYISTSALAIVGNRIYLNSSDKLPFEIHETGKYIKFWIECESGAPISVYIADAEGNIVSGGEMKTISVNNNTSFYFIRNDNYSGKYFAYISTKNSESSSIWYNSISYSNLDDAGLESINWNKNLVKNATPSNDNFYINNIQVNIASYQIDGNNYVKLRDIAYILNGTDKQFNVTWNNNIIYLSTNTSYITVGGELDKISNVVQLATKSKSSIYKDGHIIYYNGYLINGNNFYKLRDIAQSFNFEVSWDTGKIFINTTNQYSNNS